MKSIKFTFLKVYKTLIRRFTGYGFIKIYPVKVLYRFFNSLMLPKYAIVGEHKIYLDAQDSLNLSTGGDYKPMETSALRSEVHQGDMVLDIGANIGDDTLELARLVGTKGKVYAFEPDPINFRLLKKNIHVNGYKNVVLAKKAVSNGNGKIKLYLSENNLADHRIYASGDKRKSVDVGTITIDSYFRSSKKKIDFIKIDVQGAEMLAFGGMATLLRTNRKLKILTEFWPAGLKECGSSPEAYLDLLQRCGFKTKCIDENKKRIFRVNKEYLLRKFTVKNGKFTNLLCFRS